MLFPLIRSPQKFRHYVLTKGKIIVEEVTGLYEAFLKQTLDQIFLLEMADV
jgi:hypothetical protein